MPKISVIIPVYNVDKYIQKCITSIISQSFKNFELIIVNDGSSDNSEEICREYTLMDTRIRYYRLNHGGSDLAVKFGISKSSGDYVAFVDGDDWVDESYLEVMYLKIEKFKCDLVVTGMISELPDSREKLKMFNVDPGYYDHELIKKYIYPTLLFNGGNTKIAISGSRCSKLFKRSILLNNTTHVDGNISYGEDWLLTMPYITQCRSIFLEPNEYVYHYRFNPLSITKMYDPERFQKYNRFLEYLSKSLSDKTGYGFSDQIESLKLFNIYKSILEVWNSYEENKREVIFGFFDLLRINKRVNVETYRFDERIFILLIRAKRKRLVLSILKIKKILGDINGK